MKALDNPVTYYMVVEVEKIKDMHEQTQTHTNTHTPRLISLLLCTKSQRASLVHEPQ